MNARFLCAEQLRWSLLHWRPTLRTPRSANDKRDEDALLHDELEQ